MKYTMELTQYNRFYGLFKYMPDAVFTTMTKTTESDDICTIELKNNIQQIMIETNEFENISFDDIMNEFKQNLYPLTNENKESFIIGSLQQWVQYTAFFDIRNEREFYWIEGITVNTNTEFYNTAKNTIKKNERIPVYLKDSIFEKYIFLCYLKKNQFFNLLNDFCSLLSIDFNKLQDRVATPPQTSKFKNYSALLSELTDYIENVSVSEFNNIINHHSLSKGTPRAIWKGRPADAHRFATLLNMKLPVFNTCFALSKGRELRHNDKDKLDKGSTIIDILKGHFKK